MKRRTLRSFRPILRPRAGRKLPRELAPRRVWRLAARIPGGLEDPGFETLLQRIDEAPVLGGNAVTLYFSGEDAFPAMIEAGRAAESEILVESYILKDDATGRLFLDEVAAAAERGVTVRVLADALGSAATHAAFWQELEARGVRARLFHPLFEKLWYGALRDHRKIVVVDRRVAFTGGMNIGEEYGSPSPKPGSTWRDTHLRLEGPAAWEMAVVFSEGWTHAEGDAFDLPPLVAAEAEAPGARVLVLDARPGRGHSEVAAALAAIVGATRRRLWITNAYFAPGHRAMKILVDAARRGVDVRLLLPGKTDIPIVRHAGHGYYSELLAVGVRIFEYQSAILHAKSLVADGYATVVGSSNLDFRSFVFNAECNVLVLDRGTAGAMERAFEVDLEHSVEVIEQDWHRRPILERLGDRLARLLTPVL